MKKVIICCLVMVLITNLLILGLALIPRDKEKNTNENIIENKITSVLSIDESDSNIIGYITIGSIGLEKAPIADGTENEIIDKYVGHFKETAYLDGNVCLCSHNRAINKAAYFGDLKDLKKGDEITYITKYETKIYEVSEIKQIHETELSVLEPSEENKITLITCIDNQPDLRLCVVGVEK